MKIKTSTKTFYVGKALNLTCSVKSNQNVPVLFKWYLVRPSTLWFLSDTQVFYKKNVTLRDSGTYTCSVYSQSDVLHAEDSLKVMVRSCSGYGVFIQQMMYANPVILIVFKHQNLKYIRHIQLRWFYLVLIENFSSMISSH